MSSVNHLLLFSSRQHIFRAHYMPLSVRLSVHHTGESVKHGWLWNFHHTRNSHGFPVKRGYQTRDGSKKAIF